MIYFGIYIFEKENIMGEEKKEIMEKKKEVPALKEKKKVPAVKKEEKKDLMKKDTEKKLPIVKEEKDLVEEIIEDDGEKEVRAKTKQVRYIFKSENGWFEKERDNVRVTKYYKTQKEAIDAAKAHIKNSGLPGSIVIQSKRGRIRANSKVSAKK